MEEARLKRQPKLAQVESRYDLEWVWIASIESALSQRQALTAAIENIVLLFSELSPSQAQLQTLITTISRRARLEE